ncbi:AF4/FMR2 family member lilli-like [Anopheles cruzii]|uniref:AF4/FMR2 family member lilli-like n=1 Tax=Anopheles cruzii TaxID=68878 RepID=UPI0022EC4949|nr:AF4/FMR2 family member lilli-like [Anopheles cruzii]
MDCCSSANYIDYRHHSMNSNFCYPYTPSMLRSASPYPLAAPGRYGPDGAVGYQYHRSSALGYASSMGYPHDGYGGGGYGTSGYYGSYSSSAYREYNIGGGYGHYYGHQSQSPYSRGYGAATTGAAYLYPGRHYQGSGTLAPQHPGFARGDSYLYHHPQQRGEQPQYSSFASYGSIPTPFRSSLGSGGGTPSDPPPAKSPYATSSPGFTTTGSSHLERPVSVASALPSAPSGVNSSNGSSAALDSAARSPSASLFPNGYSPSSGYSPLSASYGPTAADDSPQLPLQPDPDEGEARRDAAVAARGATEFSPDGGSPKEARGTRKPKERKLQQQQRGMMYGGQTNGTGAGGRSSSSAGSRASSPTAAAAASASARMKSLDALTNLCWPDGEQFSSKMRKYSNASGLKSKDGANSRKQDLNDHELSAAASPSRTTGAGRRPKKQTKQQKELKSSDGKEKQANSAASVTSVPPVENKNVTPLPGFQQAFGSTEIGKFSEVFFNSSPTPNESSPSQHHHAMHHPQQQQQQLQHQQQRIQQQQQQQQQQHHHHGAVQQLLMDSLNAYESDVDTLSPQSWEPPPPAAAPATAESYEGCTGYNHLQIGTSFHPSYFESSSYSDHAVDSPLGSYFSEMTCNEFVN